MTVKVRNLLTANEVKIFLSRGTIRGRLEDYPLNRYKARGRMYYIADEVVGSHLRLSREPGSIVELAPFKAIDPNGNDWRAVCQSLWGHHYPVYSRCGALYSSRRDLEALYRACGSVIAMM
jgi:hypothetical protein